MKKHSHNQVLRNDKAQKTKDIALLEREDTALFKECPKFDNTIRDRELGFDRALTFLNLIESVLKSTFTRNAPRGKPSPSARGDSVNKIQPSSEMALHIAEDWNHSMRTRYYRLD